jgi:hypothetical protein
MVDSKFSIDIIPPNYVAQMWPKVSSMLEKAMNYAKGEISLDQLKVYLIRGEYQLMIYLQDGEIIGAIVIEWINYPNDRVMFINAIGGKTHADCVEKMYLWAKSLGATAVRGSAHESVARLWKMKYGFNTIYYTVEKRL